MVIATLMIGLVIVGISAFYASNQYNVSNIQSQAENIANGLYIEIGNTVNISSTNSVVFLTVNDFAYQGELYFTAFYVPSIYKNVSSSLSPQFAYMVNGEIQYPIVKINNAVPYNTTAGMLYDINYNVLYEGQPVILWRTPALTSPVSISLTNSPPQGYSVLILFFAQIQNNYIEVGYTWI